MKTLTIEERLALLGDAENFFADLSDAGEKNYKLGLKKAAALGTVKESLELYKKRMLDWEERTEEEIEKALNMIIDSWHIDLMAKEYDMSEEDRDFYEWGFGLAIGIMKWDEEQIKGFREMQVAYDDLVEAKLWNKTLADIIWDLSK